MKVFCSSIFFLFLFSLTTSAQSTGKLLGVVTDSITKEALLGVQIYTKAANTSSNYIDGQYELELPEGNHDLRFTYLGYATRTYTVTIKAKETMVLNVALPETATMLQTATVTTSKFAKSLGEATVSLSVVAPSLIENTNAVAVNEVLEKVPGVNTMGEQVSIRGGAGFSQGTGSRVLILLDDLPVLQADAGLPNWGDLPTENIAQIEVLKGAASALYGSTAMNGVINIRTAYPNKKPQTKISLFGTVYGDPVDANNKWWTGKNMPYKTGLQFAHRQKFGKFDLVLGSNLSRNQSFMRSYRQLDNGDIDSLPGYDNRARFTVNTRYRHSEKLIFTLNTNLNLGAQNAFLFHSRVNQDLGYYETDFAPAPRGNNLRWTIDPAVTIYDERGNRHRVQGRIFYIDNNNEANQSNQSTTLFGEYQFQRRLEQLGGLEIAAGVVASAVFSSAEVYGSNSYQHNNYAAYVQLDKKFFKRLSISLGARYEINTTSYPDSINYDVSINGTVIGTQSYALKDTIEQRPVFRIGASYELTKATFVRASWGQGYRFPTVLEKFISTPAAGITIAPNPELVSETGWSAEIGIKQGFKIGKWQGFLDIAGFWTEYKNMMEFQASRKINAQYFNLPVAFQVQNIGDTRITGLDMSLTGMGRIGAVELGLLAGYTLLNPQYQNFEDSATQADIINYSTVDYNVLKYRNRHTVKGDVQANYKGISLGVTVQYVSHMEAIDQFLNGIVGNGSNPPTKIYYFREKYNQGSLFVNLRAAYQVTTFLKVSLLVNNLLNQEYSIQPGRVEAPRNFSLRLDASF
ncbi:MAG: TonB-dependent receptor [Aureispira sp.]